MSGIGSVSNPWDLDTAFNDPPGLKAGHTVYLRGGIYSGNFTCVAKGTANNYITFRAYPGERPVIDGGLSLVGDYIKLIGIEITDSGFTDRSAELASGGNHQNGTTALYMGGDHLQVINCIISNGDQGVQAPGAALDHLVYGCLIFHNGWDNHYGHGVYHQNNEPSKKFVNNIIFDNFGYGYNPHGSSGLVDYMECAYNTIFNNGSPRNVYYSNIYQQSSDPIPSPYIYGNRTYYGDYAGGGGGNLLGDPDNATTDIKLYDNYFAHGGGAALRGAHLLRGGA